MYNLLLKTLLILVSLFYLPGLIFYPFLVESYKYYFVFKGAPYISFFGFFFLFFIIYAVLAKIRIHPLKLPFLKEKFVFYIFICVVFLYFISSVNFFVNQTSSFRHVSRLQQASFLVKMLFFIKPIVNIFVCYLLVYVVYGGKLGKITKIFIWVLIVSSIMSLNSSLQVMFPVILILVLIYPKLYRSNLISMLLKPSGILVIIFGGITVGLVIFVGVGNKVGYYYLLTPEGTQYFFNYGSVLFPRVSTSLFSLATVVDSCFFNGECSIAVQNSFFNTFSNRLSLVAGLDFDSTIIDTVNRYNYLFVFEHHALRAGASPGPLASAFYFPFYPLGILLMPLFYVFLFKSIYKFLPSYKVNSVFIACIIYLLLPFFESPLDILYIIEPIFIFFLILVVTTIFVRDLNYFGR